MRPHTGWYCSVQTVGRRLLMSFGSSCAVMILVAEDGRGSAPPGSGDAGMASADDMTARATVMANAG